jgi:hypothetical protein
MILQHDHRISTATIFLSSVALATLLIGGGCSEEKLLQPPPIPETNNINHFIDVINNTPTGTEIAGWAFIDKTETTGSEIFVVLKRGDKQGMFATTSALRPDVSKHFGNPSLDHSGFAVLIARGVMKKGEYRLGLYVKRGTQQALQYTGKTVKLD